MTYFMCSYKTDSFYHQNETPSIGMVCMFSLKNPSYPEYVCVAPCGVMCIDINPSHPHMIVAGLVSGNVAVYNLQKRTNQPCHVSTAREGKHTDIVWQVSG